jgi:hypothetical protein
MKHTSDGDCKRCDEIFDRYPGFHAGLRKWFKDFQKKNVDAHISCAGRGREDQEYAVAHRLSRAHWGDSAHNWNAAIDLFCQAHGKDIYDAEFFQRVSSALTPDLNWYGLPGSAFPELPHVEVRAWRDLMLSKQLKLVGASDTAEQTSLKQI